MSRIVEAVIVVAFEATSTNIAEVNRGTMVIVVIVVVITIFNKTYSSITKRIRIITVFTITILRHRITASFPG